MSKFKEHERFIMGLIGTIQYGLVVGGLRAIKYKDSYLFKTWMIFTLFLLISYTLSYWIVSSIMKKPFKNIRLEHFILFNVPLTIGIVVGLGFILSFFGFNIYPAYSI